MTKADATAQSQMAGTLGLGARTRILYAILFLALTTYCYGHLVVTYMYGLVEKNQIGRWSALVPYLDTAASTFLALQLLAVWIFFRVGRQGIKVTPLRLQLAQLRLLHAAYGFLGGAAIVLLGLPLILRFDLHSGLVNLLTGEFYSFHSASVIVLLVVVLPILGETVYRGIFFDRAQGELSTLAAAIAVSVLFAYTWPVFNFGAAFLLSIANCILYRISKNVIPGVIASALVTASYAAILIARMLS